MRESVPGEKPPDRGRDLVGPVDDGFGAIESSRIDAVVAESVARETDRRAGTARAAKLHELRRLVETGETEQMIKKEGLKVKRELAKLERPTPGSHQLLIRVRCCGVCRTDLHVVDGDLTDPRLPIVPGHEIVGRISAMGPGVARVSPGGRGGHAKTPHPRGMGLPQPAGGCGGFFRKARLRSTR